MERYLLLIAFLLLLSIKTKSEQKSSEEGNILAAFLLQDLQYPDFKTKRINTFVERTGSDTIIHNTITDRVKRGDIVVWNNELYDSTNEIKEGSVEGYCVILPSNVYECVITIDFQLSGRIMIQGSYASNPDKIPVVGGTGCFQHLVGGEAELTVASGSSKNETKYDLDLLW